MTKFDLHSIPRPVNNRPLFLQIPTIHDAKLSLGTGVVLPRRLDHCRRCIDAQYILHCWQEVLRELAIAAADVEDFVGGLGGQVSQESLSQFGDERGGGGVCLTYRVRIKYEFISYTIIMGLNVIPLRSIGLCCWLRMTWCGMLYWTAQSTKSV